MFALSELRDDATRTADHGFYRHEGTGPNHAELVEEAKAEIRGALVKDECLIWIHGGTPGRPWPVADQLYDTTGAHLDALFTAACATGQSGATFGQIGEAFWRWQQAAIAALAESIADHRMDGGRATWVKREVKR